MKVAFFVHCFFPDHFYGTETYTLELAKNYQNLGHDVVVVSAIFQGEPRNDQLISHYTYQGVPVIQIDKNHLPHTRVKETYYQSEMAGVLTKVLRDVSPDLVHVTHLINHTAALLEATHALRIPTYATFTDFFGICWNNKLENAEGEMCAGPNPSRTNCIACYVKTIAGHPAAPKWATYAVASPFTTRGLAKSMLWIRKFPGLRGGPIDGLVEDITSRPATLAHLYNTTYRGAVAPTNFLRSAYEANRIVVPLHSIRFGVDIDRSPKPIRPTDQKPVIGFIGQIAPHKGPDLLLEAFCRLPIGRAKLRIFGPENQDAGYMQRLKSMAAGKEVEFLGTFASSRMAEVLRDMDLLVIPSRWYENSPLVLLNALATHTPVLVADVQGMTEFIKPGINGSAFSRGSADDLYTQLASLTSDPEILKQMAKTTAYDRTPASMAVETLQMYA